MLSVACGLNAQLVCLSSYGSRKLLIYKILSLATNQYTYNFLYRKQSWRGNVFQEWKNLLLWAFFLSVLLSRNIPPSWNTF